MKGRCLRGMLAAVVTVTVASSLARAAQPSLDPTFGNAGYARTNVQSGYVDAPNTFLFQPDFKIVTAGFSEGPSGTGLALTRHNADGSPDLTFGGGTGKFTLQYAYRDIANAVALQADGKILLAGVHAENNFGSSLIPALYRFNANGSPDDDFVSGGMLAVRWDPISGGDMSGVTVLPNGTIVVAGRSTANANGGVNGLGLWHVLPNGTFDSSFGFGNGKQVFDIVTPSLLTIRPGVAFTPAFDTYFVSTIFRSGRVEFLVLRLDVDGNIIPFASGNLLLPGIEASNDRPSICVQSDGKFIVGATTPAAQPGYTQVTAFRFLADGTLDDQFGTNGRADFSIGPYANRCNDVAVASNGKIMLAANLGATGGLFRLLSNGTPDAAFGNSGGAELVVGENGTTGWYNKIAFDAQGRLHAAGQESTDNANFFLSRFDAAPTGVRDTTPSLRIAMSAFPNPTDAGTTFSFELPHASDVVLEIFDVAGRRVASIANEQRGSGHNEVTWSGASAASGVFFARLTVRDALTGSMRRSAQRFVRLR